MATISVNSGACSRQMSENRSGTTESRKYEPASDDVVAVKKSLADDVICIDDAICEDDVNREEEVCPQYAGTDWADIGDVTCSFCDVISQSLSSW